MNTREQSTSWRNPGTGGTATGGPGVDQTARDAAAAAATQAQADAAAAQAAALAAANAHSDAQDIADLQTAAADAQAKADAAKAAAIAADQAYTDAEKARALAAENANTAAIAAEQTRALSGESAAQAAAIAAAASDATTKANAAQAAAIAGAAATTATETTRATAAEAALSAQVAGKGSGDWKADGSVLATGSFNMNGKYLYGASFIAVGGGTPGLSLSSNIYQPIGGTANVNWDAVCQRNGTGNPMLVNSLFADLYISPGTANGAFNLYLVRGTNIGASLTADAFKIGDTFALALPVMTASAWAATSPGARAFIGFDNTNSSLRFWNPSAAAWQFLATTTSVLTAALTGLVTTSNAAVVATDTLLVGVGKLQAQINAIIGGLLPTVVKTASYTTVSTDGGLCFEINSASANTFTFAALAANTSGQINIVGAGQTTFAVSGLTLLCPLASPKGQGAGAVVYYKVSSTGTSISLSGDLV